MTCKHLIKLFLSAVCVCLLAIVNTSAQHLQNPKLIRERGDFTHVKTQSLFPAILNEFERTELFAFDKQQDDISGTYVSGTGKNSIDVNVYVYPAGDAFDTRFRNQFKAAVEAIMLREGIYMSPVPTHIRYQKDGYTVNGFRSDFSANKKNTMVELYECGDWFLKIRVTAKNKSPEELHHISTQFRNYFNPTNLVKHSTLALQSTVHVAPAIMKDSGMAYCTLGSMLTTLEWYIKNVDSVERLAGVPNQYLLAQLTSLKAFVTHADSAQGNVKLPTNIAYIQDIKKLMNAGFLDEFLMEINDMMLIYPKDWKFDYRAYDIWREQNTISIKPNVTYYVIRYMDMKELKGKENTE